MDLVASAYVVVAAVVIAAARCHAELIVLSPQVFGPESQSERELAFGLGQDGG